MHLVRYADRSTWRPEVGVAADGESRPTEEVLMLPPVDGRTEVWAAGVTYERSMGAHIEETKAAQDGRVS